LTYARYARTLVSMISDGKDPQVKTMTTAQAAAHWGITEASARRRLADHPEIRPLPSAGRANVYDADQIRGVEVRRGRRTDLTELVDLLHAAGIPYTLQRPRGVGHQFVIDGLPLSPRQAREYLARHRAVQALEVPPAVTHSGTAGDGQGVPRRALVGALQVAVDGVTGDRPTWRLTGVTAEHHAPHIGVTDVPAALAWATDRMRGHAVHVTGWQHHRDGLGEWWEPIPPVTRERPGVNGHVDGVNEADISAELADRGFMMKTLPDAVSVFLAPDGRVAVSGHWAGQTLTEIVVRNLAEPAGRPVRRRAARPPLDRARNALVQTLDALGYPSTR
jgi:hypothetical protein